MTSPALIDTTKLADRMRARIIRLATREILIARVAGSDQEPDLTVPPNAGGLGRVRHFRRQTASGWPDNPLPIDPAAKSLGALPGDIVRAQVFQNAACAWRCWYCYVPFELLGGNERSAVWTTAEALVELFSQESDRAHVLDLSGGSPDLSPEWILWMMDALEGKGLSESVYLWSDDNLSTDFVFSKLDPRQRTRLADYRHYGRVCCFKGFDEASFVFNTGARPDGFAQQFELFARYLSLGIDLYGYVTLTGPSFDTLESGIPAFIDRLQEISTRLPLRIVPLQIGPFGPMLTRSNAADRGLALSVQEAAIAIWRRTLAERFSASDLRLSITEVAVP
jgi:uncharacterized Fe-S cluster-containing radical SAM superfamily protein